MTLVDPYVVCEKNTHEMTLVVPVFFRKNNTNSITPVVVSKKNTHAMTLVDPRVVCEENTHAMTLAVVNEKNTHFNDTGGSISGM